MKFRKFGKALLMSALFTGAVFSLTSCVQSYTVGFLYVTGNQSSGSGQGIISGFKIDHNTGKLSAINGLPVGSGGANPVRADLITGSRFLFVLNQGKDASGGNNCTSATSPCTGANIVEFSVSGNGALLQQQIFYPHGNNPLRMFSDALGTHLYVLDHDAPDSGSAAATNSCSLALGPSVHVCGAVEAYTIDDSTGRLSLLQNAQVTSSSGQPLPYFPVPVNPIDMVLTSGHIFTLAGAPSTGDVVYPYAYDSNSGQLTVSQNGAQPINAFRATAIQANTNGVYVMDNEPVAVGGTSYLAQILPFSVGNNGALQAQSIGAIPIPGNETNPLFMLLERGSSGKWAYVANSGDNSSTNNTQSGIAGYQVDQSQKTFTNLGQSPYGTGAGPQCLVEDPSNQFIYTANFNDSTITGHSIDRNIGELRALNGAANKAYTVPGPATYCVVNGRTS
jgi:6-phosphogluconolactonase (cycloisomerase 2 family)